MRVACSHLSEQFQEPIQLFGPLRDTIDPYHRSRRTRIIRALKAVHLWTYIKCLPGRIDCILDTNDHRFRWIAIR